MFIPVHTTTTRTVEVPVDYGPMPAGWEKLTSNQKRWALNKAKENRWPVWSVLDLGVPDDQEIERLRAEKRAGDMRFGAIIISVLGIILAAIIWLAVKPDCAWPTWFEMYWVRKQCEEMARHK